MERAFQSDQRRFFADNLYAFTILNDENINGTVLEIFEYSLHQALDNNEGLEELNSKDIFRIREVYKRMNMPMPLNLNRFTQHSL